MKRGGMEEKLRDVDVHDANIIIRSRLVGTVIASLLGAYHSTLKHEN